MGIHRKMKIAMINSVYGMMGQDSVNIACTMACARWLLDEDIKLAGDNFVYCDTDSVKVCKSDPDTASENIRKGEHKYEDHRC